MTVSGSNTFAGSNLYLTELSKKLMQDFAVYLYLLESKYTAKSCINFLDSSVRYKLLPANVFEPETVTYFLLSDTKSEG